MGKRWTLEKCIEVFFSNKNALLQWFDGNLTGHVSLKIWWNVIKIINNLLKSIMQ